MIRGQGVCAPIFQHGQDVYCLTVAHVLTGAQQISIDGHPAQVVHADIQQEIAMLKFQSSQPVPVVRTRLNQTTVPTNGCLWTFDGPQTVRRCGPVKGDIIQLNVIPGQSGSPVLNEQGEMIGLVHMSNGKFIPWSRYEAMLAKLGCIEKKAPIGDDRDHSRGQSRAGESEMSGRIERLEKAIVLLTERMEESTKDGRLPSSDLEDSATFSPREKGLEEVESRVSQMDARLNVLQSELDELRPLKTRHLQLFDTNGKMTDDVALSPVDAIKIQSKVRINAQ